MDVSQFRSLGKSIQHEGVVEASAGNRLAVFMMQLRSTSETFIRRHVEGLAPGQTVAVAQLAGLPERQSCPSFIVERWQLRLPVRLAARAGISRESLLTASVKRFLRRHKVGVVLGEYMDQFVDFVPMLDRMGLPYVVQAHGIDVSSSLRTPGMAERYQLYRSARAVLTRSDFHRRRLIQIGLPADIIHLNPGGVDVAPDLPERTPESAYRFLAIGRMVPQKAPIILLEAFRSAVLQNPNLTLDYVGSGPLFAAASQFVRACGLGGRVRLHGTAPEKVKQRLLRECGVFIQHSAVDPETGDEESLPASIQEAMAHGLAVVSTRHAGIPEAVRDGETGLLVEEGDAKAMAAAFLEIPARAAALGSAGYSVAAENYSWEDEKQRLQEWLGLNS
jgi:colanic acid/amylovoran biosynthesis glycosyltransferase